MNFIVLSSSRGTVFKAVLERIKDGSLHAKCLGLITDRADRGCIAHAKAHGIAVVIVDRTNGEDREAYDKRLHAAIESPAFTPAGASAGRQTLIACMGWMFILSPWFVHQWKNKILNVHPSLLPKYPGAHAHDLVLAAGDTESGMTIHLIDEGVDTGRILVQKKCSVFLADTEDTLKHRVQELECEWFPKILEEIAQGRMKL